ncbi:hypothetical protein ACF06X_33660 [Streptomyces sp. NPDC015346]|uniref:hypothetical protein n=1 Tax=Streptomyces sp. NPDC015346 TaxID=3364954 RepID=UPI0036FCAF8C
MTDPTPAECLLDACTQGCTTECREAINRAWTSLRGTTPAEPARRHTVDTLTNPKLTKLYEHVDYLTGYAATLETYAAEQRERAEQAEAKAAAMTAAMQSTAADALKHRGCHMKLMAQCTRAERAEAKLERVRAFADELARGNPKTGNEPLIADRIRAAFDEQQEQQPKPTARARCRCGHARDLHNDTDCAGCTHDGRILAPHTFVAAD